MKKNILLFFVLGLTVISAQGIGRVHFASVGPTVNAKFELPVNHPLGQQLLTASLSQFRADLFWSPGNSILGVQSEDLVFKGSFNQSFLSLPAQAGYFAGGIKPLIEWTNGPVVAQVRVWDTSFGDFDTAKVSFGSAWVESDMFLITPTESPVPAPNLVGLGSSVTYTLNYVPEPSILALASVGGLFVWRLSSCKRQRAAGANKNFCQLNK